MGPPRLCAAGRHGRRLRDPVKGINSIYRINSLYNIVLEDCYPSFIPHSTQYEKTGPNPQICSFNFIHKRKSADKTSQQTRRNPQYRGIMYCGLSLGLWRMCSQQGYTLCNLVFSSPTSLSAACLRRLTDRGQKDWKSTISVQPDEADQIMD